MRINYWPGARPVGLCFSLLSAALAPATGRAAEDTEPAPSGTQQQLDRLQEQLSNQQREIDRLRRAQDETAPAAFNLGDKVRLSGEGGVAFFDSTAAGQWPESEFRVDEARLFVDALLADDLYFFAEITLAVREDPEADVKMGELYVDFENVSRLWGAEGRASIRAGRMDVPFGEEYLVRDAFDNPLISHSLTDFWGIDEGIEVYGSLDPVDYVVAVQNGGHPSSNDFDSDKSVTVRVGVEPADTVRLSLSAMRTGDLDVAGDKVSELWFGNGFFRALGAPETTTTFHAEVLEGDAAFQWARGHVKAAAGVLSVDDNDTAADNERDAYFYWVEGVQHLQEKFYAAARFSQIVADDGLPIVGNGTRVEYFNTKLTEEIWRLSLGLGYRLAAHVTLKAEYTFEQGDEVGGEERDDTDLAAAEAAFKF